MPVPREVEEPGDWSVRAGAKIVLQDAIRKAASSESKRTGMGEGLAAPHRVGNAGEAGALKPLG